ncbi:MAG: heme oxygenase (biliverdin-producing) [Bdellovibrionia bacterium]
MQIETNTATLSELLKSSTQSIHGQVEGQNFIRRLFSGNFTTAEYWLYLWSLHQVYTRLEESMSTQRFHPAVSKIFFCSLQRKGALESDLSFWQEGQMAVPKDLKLAVEQYRERLKVITEQDPSLLVSHAYVRYLGDLSGGQMISKRLKQRWNHNIGFAFYDFNQVDNITELKQEYRKRLNHIGEMFPEKIETICSEANTAFELNGKIFSALDSCPSLSNS